MSSAWVVGRTPNGCSTPWRNRTSSRNACCTRTPTTRSSTINRALRWGAHVVEWESGPKCTQVLLQENGMEIVWVTKPGSCPNGWLRTWMHRVLPQLRYLRLYMSSRGILLFLGANHDEPLCIWIDSGWLWRCLPTRHVDGDTSSVKLVQSFTRARLRQTLRLSSGEARLNLAEVMMSEGTGVLDAMWEPLRGIGARP